MVFLCYFPSRRDLSTPASPRSQISVSIRVCQGLVGGEAPSPISSSTSNRLKPRLFLKTFRGERAISQFDLAFHPYPQVIRELFNVNQFGPPVT